jgi:hypothetical protein
MWFIRRVWAILGAPVAWVRRARQSVWGQVTFSLVFLVITVIGAMAFNRWSAAKQVGADGRLVAHAPGEEAPKKEPEPLPTPPMRILQEPDGAGGMDVVLTIPDGSPRFIPSTCTLQRGEACYISTRPSMPGLEVGGDHEGDTLWCTAPAWEFTPEQPFRYLILTVPRAEVVFRTTQPLSPGTYHIMIRKSPFPLAVDEYAKGIPVSRLYH